MNKLIELCYQNGSHGAIYNYFAYPVMVLMILLLLWYGKKLNVKPWKAAVLFVSSVLTISLLVGPMKAFDGLFVSDPINSSVRTYIFIPLVLWAACKLLKVPAARGLDLVTPALAIYQGLVQIACCFPGCCHGYEYPWGIWNPRLDAITFPVQLIECVLTAAVGLLLIDHARKNDYKVTGKAYPTFLMAYGIIRFFMEYMRASEKIIGNLSSISLHAALMALVGLVWYFVLLRKERKAAEPLP